MEIRDYQKADFQIIDAWCESWGWPRDSEHLLSDLGMVVKHDNKVLSMGFIYTTNSPWAWLGFVMGNPKLDKIERRDSLGLLVRGLKAKAGEMGFTVMIANTDHPTLLEVYKRNGLCPVKTGITTHVGGI